MKENLKLFFYKEKIFKLEQENKQLRESKNEVYSLLRKLLPLLEKTERRC